MATHPTIAAPTGADAKSLADIKAGVGTITGVTTNGAIGADGVSLAATADVPNHGVCGESLTIDDATYLGDHEVGTEQTHTQHYPGNPAFDSEQ